MSAKQAGGGGAAYIVLRLAVLVVAAAGLATGAAAAILWASSSAGSDIRDVGYFLLVFWIWLILAMSMMLFVGASIVLRQREADLVNREMLTAIRDLSAALAHGGRVEIVPSAGVTAPEAASMRESARSTPGPEQQHPAGRRAAPCQAAAAAHRRQRQADHPRRPGHRAARTPRPTRPPTSWPAWAPSRPPWTNCASGSPPPAARPRRTTSARPSNAATTSWPWPPSTRPSRSPRNSPSATRTPPRPPSAARVSREAGATSRSSAGSYTPRSRNTSPRSSGTRPFPRRRH